MTKKPIVNPKSPGYGVPTEDPELEAVAAKLDDWRAQPRRRPVPDELWDEILALLETKPRSFVTRRLRLESSKVSQMIEARGSRPPAAERAPDKQVAPPSDLDKTAPSGVDSGHLVVIDFIDDAVLRLAKEHERLMEQSVQRVAQALERACEDLAARLTVPWQGLQVQLDMLREQVDTLGRILLESQTQGGLQVEEGATDISLQAPDGSVFKINALHGNAEMYALAREFIVSFREPRRVEREETRFANQKRA